MDWATPDEADLQATESQKSQYTWISGTNENSRRQEGSKSPPQERSRSTSSLDRAQITEDIADRPEHFPRRVRIQRGSEIRKLLEQGKRKGTRSLEVFAAGSKGSFSRFGVIVPKYGRRIVDRNQLKRRLREIGRRSALPQLNSMGWNSDVLVRAGRSAYEASFAELEMEINSALEVLCSKES